MAFKSFENINECGIKFIVRYQNGDEESLRHYYDGIAQIQLSDNVPDDVKSLFDTAKNIALYGYFSYDLQMPAVLQGCIAMERALKIYFKVDNEKPPPFRQLVEKAIEREYVTVSDFKRYQNSQSINLLEDFLEVFVQMYRNGLAHGSTMRTGSVKDELHDICDFINGLYKNREK